MTTSTTAVPENGGYASIMRLNSLGEVLAAFSSIGFMNQVSNTYYRVGFVKEDPNALQGSCVVVRTGLVVADFGRTGAGASHSRVTARLSNAEIRRNEANQSETKASPTTCGMTIH